MVDRHAGSGRRAIFGWIGLSVLMVVVGVILNWWTVVRTERGMREVLLVHALAVAHAVDLRRVEALSGSANDLELDDYQELKEQLASIKSASDKCRFVYLMGRRPSGEIFFFVDSEPSDSPDYSPPGQIYQEATDQLSDVFRTKTSTVEGPVADRWGIWTSAFVPVIDPHTGNPIAVLGIDTDGRAWRRSVLRAAAWSTGLTIAALALLFLSVFLSQSRRRLLTHQQHLRQSREKFRMLFDQSVEGIYVHDLDGNILDVNQMAISQSGYTREELLNLRVFDVSAQVWDTERQAREWRTWLPGETHTCESTHRRKDGTEFPVEISIGPISQDGEQLMLAIVRDIAERKRNREALQEERQRLAYIIEATNVGTWECNLQTGKTILNERWAEMIGYTLEEIYPLTVELWERFAHPGDFRERRELQARHFAGEIKRCEIEIRMRHKDGHWVWVLDRGKVSSWTEDGKPLLMQGTHQDVSEQRQKKDSLVKTQFTMDRATDSIAWVDGDGNFVYVNDALCGATGYSRKELLAMKAFDIDLVSRIWNWEQHKNEMRRLGSMYFESQHITRDGRAYPVEVSAKYFDFGGRYMECAFVRDISQRKQAEQELRAREQKYRTIVETSAEWIWEIDLEGNLIYSNPEGTRLIGYSSDEVVGKPVLHFIHEEDRQMIESQYPGLVERKEGWRGWVLRTRHKDGSYRFLESNASPVINSAGDVVGYLGANRDITERKRAEEEREKLREQLAQSQKMESVGRLAGGVAHDFNNMLGVILGHTELALEKMDPSQPLFTDLQEIRKAAERSANLTRQLLAFARKQTVSPKVLDLNETVDGTLKMLRRLIGEGIDLVWQPGKNVAPVKIDPSQIDQVLANLCVNARDAVGNTGRITIETANAVLDKAYCAVHPGFVPGEYVQLTVTDDGCGMDPEMLEHIFEPFFTTKEVGKGTGLGLPTVYGIVKQNNGFINVCSEPRLGTTIKIYLPPHKAAIRYRHESGARELARGDETVLLVEDEPAILQMAVRMLKNLGYTVMAASSPGEALRLAKEHWGQVDLLMTDVVMPQMNGRDLAKNLLALYPNLKRLFMSGYTADVIASHGVLDEGVSFIQKPFSTGQIAAKVRETLDQR